MSAEPDDEEVEATRSASQRGEPRVVVRMGCSLVVLSFRQAEDLRTRLRLLQALALESSP